MKRYKIVWGSGICTPFSEEIEVENWECEQDAVDKLIDEHETNGHEGLFINPEFLNDYFEDEYIIGGNHGRYLYHGGLFSIHLTYQDEE